MAKTIPRKYSGFVAGYYDDFNASRAIADDNNTTNITGITVHTVSHFGNSLNGEARLNPRYKKAYKERVDGDETHNLGAHEFLTTDTIRHNPSKFEGKAQPSYPDGITQGNRYQFGADATLENYQLLTNGYNTAGSYSVELGNNDPSQGKSASITIPDKVDASNLYIGGSAEATGSGGVGATNLFQYANICSVHVGEVGPDCNTQGTSGKASEPFSKAILEPIESLDSGKPFLAINTHIRESISLKRLISYNANLGAATDGDIFGVRMAWRNWSGYDNGQSSGHSYTLRMGFRKGDYTDNKGFDTATPAASYTFTTSSRKQDPNNSGNNLTVEATGLKTGYQDRNPWFKKSALTGSITASLLMSGGAVDGGYNVFQQGTTPESTSFPSSNVLIDKADQLKRWEMENIWNDIEFKFDWTAGTYDVLHDGIVVSTGVAIGTNPDTSNPYKANEVFGWELVLNSSGDVDGFQNSGTNREYTQITTLIDRAYLWRELADATGKGGDTITLSNMKITYTANGISQCGLTLQDDYDNLNLFKVFEEETNQMQELMIFRDNIHRCVWRGHIEKYNTKQTKKGEKQISLSARDYFAALDRSIPVWEVGQSAQIDETEPVGWRPYESANMIEKLHFGATSLQRGTNTLSFEKPNYTLDTSSRMRLGSAHPIQLYNEEGGAPDRVYDFHAKLILKGFQKTDDNYANPQSLANPLRVYADNHGYIQGESITITGTSNYNGTFTVHDPQTNFFYIDTPYVASGKIQAIHNHDGYEQNKHVDVLRNFWSVQFAEPYPNPRHNGGATYIQNGQTINHNIDWSNETITISDTRLLRGNGVAGQRNKRTSALPSDSSATINGVNVFPRVNAIGDFETPIQLKHSSRCQHFPQGHNSFNLNHGLVYQQADIPDPVNSVLTAKNLECGYMYALIDNKVSSNPKVGRVTQTLGQGVSPIFTRIPYDSFFRTYSNNLLRGPPTAANCNSDSEGGAIFLPTYRGPAGGSSQQDFNDYCAWFKINCFNDNAWSQWSMPGSPDYAHGGSETLTNTITKLYFENGSAINVYDLYVGQRIVLRYGGMDSNGAPMTILQNGTGSPPSGFWTGHAVLVFEITGFSNMPTPGQTWNSSTHYLDVSQITNGGYAATYADLANFYPNHDDINGNGAGTQGRASWYIYDSHDLEYCNEVGQAEISNANATLIQNTNRAVHSRWIQDLPKSLWFQMQFGNIKKDKLSYGKVGANANTNQDILLDSDVIPTTYTGGQILYCNSSAKIATTNPDGSTIQEILVMAVEGGTGEIVNPDGTVDAFTFSGLAGFDASDDTFDRFTGVKFLSQFHAAGSKIRIREVERDFKHIWVLWADMRNDGTADADGGLRKKKFGLQMPMANNYSVSIEYVDSENPDGTPVKFADLAIGSDLDMWELDATLEPHTQQPWSALGSNALGGIYADWENKAGAFVVIDTSKFWNLNTGANLGKTGRIGGGRTDLQDYYAVGTGFPIMMDNYWVEAMPSYKTVQYPYDPHPQQLDFIHDASPVVQSMPQLFGSINRLFIDDVTEWNDSGVGRIVGVAGTGTGRQTFNWFYSWSGKNSTDNYLDNVIIQAVQPSQIQTQQQRKALAQTMQMNNNTTTPITINLDDYDSLTAYNTIASLNGMRFMMRVSGKVQNENSGTWFESSKIRFLNMLSQTKNWLGKSHLTGISSMKNVPMTKTMNINGSQVFGNPNWTHNNTNFDTFGSVVEAKGTTTFGAINKIQKATGTGIKGNGQTFTYQIGPDGRLDLRPGYNAFFNFDRSVLNISNMNTSIQQKVTHVRVYFNDSKSYCDYPTVDNTTENIRWKILDMPQVGTLDEAKYVAKQEYLKSKKAPLSLNAKIVRGTQSNDVMLDGARYGYIADPQRTVYGQWPHFMMGRMNNNFFPGSVSALDGQLNNTGTALVGSSGRDASVVNASDEITWAGNNYWYGANSLANAIEVVHIPQNLPKYSMTTGNQLRFFITVDGQMQSTPTATTLEEAAQYAKFKLIVIDPIFVDDATRNAGFVLSNGVDSNGDPNLIGEAELFGLAQRGGVEYVAAVSAAGQGHSASSDVASETTFGSLQNGFVEVNLPPTYAFGSNIVNKIIVSINRDYLESLIRKRCGDSVADVLKPAHTHIPSEGVSGFHFLTSSINSKSIFPLGGRYYNEFGEGTVARTVWYAPRLIITDDINFRTSTALTYSDEAYGFVNKPMIINSVNWEVNALGYEQVMLGLTTDESHFLSNLGSMFLTPPIIKDPPQAPYSAGGTTSGRGGETGEEGEPVPPSGNPIGPVPLPDGGSFQPTFPPGLVGNQANSITGNIVNNIGINNFSQGALDRIRGKMDFPVGTGEWGLLGQERPQPALIGSQFLISNDGAFTPSAGSASLSETGIVLPGRTFSGSESAQSEYSEVSGIQVIPNNITSANVVVEAMIDTAMHSEPTTSEVNPDEKIKPAAENYHHQDTGRFAVVFCTVNCLETGSSVEQTTVIPVSENGVKYTLFSNKVEGGDIPGNHLEVLIRRVAGDGQDSADLQSVKLKSISVSMNVQNDATEGASSFFNSNVAPR
jgi:hypothetical protein